jgi:hypothetical protein
MTYVLAWKTDSGVFLAADSALTSTHLDSDRHSLKRSSFGEEHIFEADRIVEERVLKLFLRNNIGVAIAGHYENAINIVKSFYENIAAGSLPRRALDDAVFQWYPSMRDGAVELAVAYFNDQPHLLYFNGHDALKDDGQVVHMGSAPPGYKQINESWLEDAPIQAGNHPDAQLAAMLGILQSHGVLNSTLQAGIGGAFAGLRVDRSGGHWQPDLLFIEDGTRRFVSTCIRNDCMVINSTVLGESRCFLTFIPPREREFLMEQANRAIEEARDVKRSALYDYVFMMKTDVRSLTLIHMDKKLRHRLLWIVPFAVEEGSGETVRIYPLLRAIMNRTDQGIVIVPYEPPDETEVPEDRIIRKEIRPED